MIIYQIGSSLTDVKTAKDFDLLIIVDKPVDICLYTTKQWQDFNSKGFSDVGQRVVLYPAKRKNNNLKEKLRLL